MKDRIIEIIATHRQLLAEFEGSSVDIVISAAEMIADCLAQGGRIYLCGNGGSAADAQHIAGEFVGRFRRDRRALAAVALSTDASVLTCIANDFGYEEIFARQVRALTAPGDILWAFSTSGGSKNVVAAAESARQIGAKVLAFTGRRDTTLEKLSDLCLAVDAPTTAAAQEIHQLAYHMICDLVDTRLFSDTDA